MALFIVIWCCGRNTAVGDSNPDEDDGEGKTESEVDDGLERGDNSGSDSDYDSVDTSEAGDLEYRAPSAEVGPTVPASSGARNNARELTNPLVATLSVRARLVLFLSFPTPFVLTCLFTVHALYCFGLLPFVGYILFV